MLFACSSSALHLSCCDGNCWYVYSRQPPKHSRKQFFDIALWELAFLFDAQTSYLGGMCFKSYVLDKVGLGSLGFMAHQYCMGYIASKTRWKKYTRRRTRVVWNICWYKCEIFVWIGTVGPFKSSFTTLESPCLVVSYDDRDNKQGVQRSCSNAHGLTREINRSEFGCKILGSIRCSWFLSVFVMHDYLVVLNKSSIDCQL